jgi:hypothetical protein
LASILPKEQQTQSQARKWGSEKMTPEKLQQRAMSWQGKRVLVVGDLMLDEYIIGSCGADFA